ncbi:caspase family protein [Paucibacter sp. DJ1R-11]|uniref:caspase family protein n=1 Tax=Paucibacter sp. DJ1R-11 TaxID=2893556 RepID=UPI0021E38A2F|nr:caspase family protein [Paucibacter sp. DJ1R-11]MCV2362610.1 caspase family protein [Paucibacter sp. DJ1R-11]
MAQFEVLLQQFPFTRKVNAVHMHHTWRPRREDFRGHETIVSMWRHHTQVNGWSDIAQHITIDPQGFIWLGRNWNAPPASAGGHNGNSVAGPFMFEMIGDFDTGREPFDGGQKNTALRVVALVQRHFGLRAATLRFHNMMSTKTCPGSGINYDTTLAEVEQLHDELEAVGPAQGGARAAVALQAFPDEQDQVTRQAIQALTRVAGPTGESGDVEDDHGEEGCLDCGDQHEPATTARGDSGLDPATLAAMRPHLVNLRSGMFSDDGEFKSTPGDVDAIFEEHLPRALAALPAGQRLQLLFYAHGGLVSESSGLQGAHRHIGWWKRNGVYPIYFIWETGFFETIGQLLLRTRAGTRDLADYTTDPLIETAARVLQGPRIWGGMKWSAERAAQPGGASAYVAQKLHEFLAQHAERATLHAIGHSAGSIFHAHFLPACRALGVPAFKTLQLLAPAIRVDTFKQRLLPGLLNGELAESTSLFTMSRDFERDDHCAHVYRKSLLYLIHHALEDDRRTPILGLEESLRSDAELKAFFGLTGAAGRSEVIWSKSPSDTGRSASQSTKHGGFDDDAPTMNSVARRLLDVPDAHPIDDFPVARGLERAWTDEVDLPADWPVKPAAAPAVPAPLPLPLSDIRPAKPEGGGRRLALCMGVDAYPNPQHRLAGCINDARAWASALQQLGFEARLLLDGQVTRAAMDTELRRLVKQARAGDVIVVQYSGHGTHVNDLDGDEDDGQDEALCPVDFASGALYIDDDIANVLADLPSGVNFTLFMDCCHSGTNTRFAGLNPGAGLLPGTLARYVAPTEELQQAHARFRSDVGSRATANRTQQQIRHVKFAACQDHEVALESGGNGEFTRRALRVLQRQRLSNEAFLQAVLAEFGASARQKPLLDCARAARAQGLLQPLGRTIDAVDAGPALTSSEGSLVPVVVALAESVQLLSRKLAS